MTLKNLIISISFGALIFLFLYLIGSFVQISFNISKWSEDARFIVGALGGLTSLIIMIAIFSIKNID
jgi:hypothetical protein